MNVELGVLLLPSLEQAYQASPWRRFSCTSEGTVPGPLPCVGSGTSVVRYVAWQRGERQAPSLGADGVLTVPLLLPYRLPPEGAPAAAAGTGGGSGAGSELFWLQPDWGAAAAADERLGTDRNGLPYSAYKYHSVRQLRVTLTDGDSWQHEVVSVLQHGSGVG